MEPVVVTISRNSHKFDALADRLKKKSVAWIHSDPGAASIATIGRHMPGLVIVEAGKRSNGQVLACVERIKDRYPTIPIFLIAQKSSEALAIGALRAGVKDYFKPPFCTDELMAAIDGHLFPPISRAKSDPVKDRLSVKLIGHCRIMRDIKEQLARVANADSTVLITGETGTGKELAANLIHANSARACQTMVSINCAALPDNLVESELFGYERGAFTGAVATTRGRFEQANGGTIFLDEIGDMTPFAQAKILRAIEDKIILPLGGATSIPVNFRLIAATNKDPEAMLEEGLFRDDLFYRLNVARVHMPSLRMHREDILLLVEHCINKLNRKFLRNIRGLKKEALALLYRYDWPGNVRELMNVLEGTYVNLPRKKIYYADFPAHFKSKLKASQHLPSIERKRIISTLLETNWNKSTAAKQLNWSRMTLYRKMARYKIVEKRSPRAMGIDTTL